MPPMRISLAALALAVAAAPASSQTYNRALTPSDAAGMLGFGVATAVSGDEIFVGRPGAFAVFPMPGSEPGTVHVFRSEDGAWTEYASVSAPDGFVGNGFGSAVAVNGDFLLVGAPKAADGAGVTYVFQREGDGWSYVDRIEAEGGMAGDGFGSAIAMQPGNALIGAPGRGESGAAFLYTADGAGGWSMQELSSTSAGPDAAFGAAVSLEGDLALVGAPGPTGLNFVGGQPQFQAGSAFVYERGDDGWTEAAHLTPPSGGSFGQAVLLSGGEAFVSAPLADQATGTVFRYAPNDAGAWEAGAQIAADGGTPQTLFGSSLARSGDRLVVGAPGANQFSGAAYVFAADGQGGWAQEAVLTADVTGLMGFMGNAVAAGDDFAIIGAPGSEFFEGIGFVFQRDDAGSWTETSSIVESAGGLEAIVGGEIPCGNDGTVGDFACQNVELVSFMPVREVGGRRGIMVSDVWGWTDPDTGREYAILGRFDGTSFVDVTNAENPRYLGNLPLTDGANPNLWRDMKVYANHAFIVADNAGQHGMQVFDLTRLRDVGEEPVEFDEDAIYTDFASAHNIVINEGSGFAYVVGGSGGGETCGGALHMVDIRDPDNPTFAGCYADPATGTASTGYTHDAQCVMYTGPDADYEGREVCFNASETALGIGDVTDKASPAPISHASYPSVAYSHQGWLSEDQRYFYLNDELDELQGGVSGTRTLIWNVEDLDDPVLAKEFIQDNPASDHNLYIEGDYLYESNYVSGLRVFDISDPENPVPVGFFDTVPWGEDAPGFAGSWSNYPFFESGNILVSSMREGLFVVKRRQMELVP